jgi:hypothetical protein
MADLRKSIPETYNDQSADWFHEKQTDMMIELRQLQKLCQIT